MRPLLIAALSLGACEPSEDSPGPFVIGLAPSSVSIPGTKAFSSEEIAAGIAPSRAIREKAEASCKGANFLSATASEKDPERVNYYFICQ